MGRIARRAAMLALLAGAAPAMGQGPADGLAVSGLAVSGRVQRQATLSIDDLRALPPVTIDASHLTSRGMQRASYTGALLWAVVAAAGPLDGPGSRERLLRTVVALGRDGYAVAVAVGEIDPDFEGKQVLVAYAADGQTLPGLRLVVPADRHAGRNVRDLVAIEIR